MPTLDQTLLCQSVRIAVTGVFLLSSACSSESSAQMAEARAAATAACTTIGGDPAVASSSVGAACVGCTVENAAHAADGDLASHATLHTDAAVAQGVSVRATRPDMTLPAGPFGAVVRELRVNSFAANPYFFLRTYLDGALQEEFVVGFSTGLNTGAPPGERIVQAAATQGFDAIEVSVGGAAMAGDFSLEVIEMCGAVAAEPEAEEPGTERVFAPAGNGPSWTLQGPGRHTTAEMRGWFAALEAAADSGAAVTLPVSYFAGTVVGPLVVPTAQTMNVVLTRSKMLDTATFFQINTVDHMGPFVRVYEGHLVDSPAALVHLTLADDFMRGVVRIQNDLYLVRIGMNGNLPAAIGAGGNPGYAYHEPASGEPVGCPADYIPNNNLDLLGPSGGHRWIPPYLSPEYLLSNGAAPELEARIILDADLDAYRQWGRHLPAMMIAMHVEQSVTYRHQVGVRFRIAGVHLNTIAGYYPTPLDTAATFDYMERWWGGYMADQRDIVHLLTGQPIGTYMASCIGGAGTRYGYFYTATNGESSVPSFRNMNIVSHEIGHLFSAHHHYANHVEAPGSATVMIQGYTPGDMAVFSSLSRTVIRGWAEEYLSAPTE